MRPYFDRLLTSRFPFRWLPQTGWFALLALSALAAMSCQRSEEAQPEKLTAYVDPFIGTDGKGKTYPGATVPHGMVQLSPDNGRNGWDWISGYFYPDTVIAGFSHLHLSGTGAGDLYDISFLPVAGALKQGQLDDIAGSPTVYSRFSHERETASPGYYQVFLDDYGVNVELTATERTGLQRYSFSKQDPKVRLHLGYTRNWDSVTDSYLRIVNDTIIEGYRRSTGWAKDQRVYFTAVFSAPFHSFELFNQDERVRGDTARGLNILAVFDLGDAEEAMIKTGISSVSIANARLNLSKEQEGFDFEAVKAKAQNSWEAALSRVKVKASPDNRAQFYTAMYHSMLAPTLFSDVNGEYKGADGHIHKVEGHARYTTFSLWDTYRALHPWLTVAHPEKVPGMINSMLDFYQEYGQLPVWNMLGNETDMMIGYHSAPVITDAYFKGIGGFDPQLAYEAMKKSAMQDKFGLEAYKERGYVPYEWGNWNVSLTLEYAYDDWCIARMAEALGYEADHNYFTGRASNYKNHFDPETGFFRARSKDGPFKAAFDPLAYHPEDYCEANAWQYFWYVPQDVAGLAGLAGGEKEFELKLDQMFELEQAPGDLPAWISGYIGQYVHGNEPAHHVPYLYQFAGAPHKTQQRVRQIMKELYTTRPDGLCGNEDCGQMSAWYLFSALGFYPVNPADGRYILGSPEVEEAIITLPGGKEFKIIAKGQSEEHVYVKAISLNGAPLQEYFITHEQLMAGGELVFEMTDKPE
ncbi:MAG: GH92 family glycosyl hydrolase [Phaeodactylibacter sp.]|nr:GH92 family glycosyl hydrolase [Phaeodactylibacter sp.]MCB9050785.1 glycoside hydrolase family 92 protein [Lewinellaceae bacterium]